MPMIIQHIDAIARQKQRDVLFVQFESDRMPDEPDVDFKFSKMLLDWDELPVRQQIIDWLDEHGMKWQPCGDFANTSVMSGYQGQIYIDVPYDTSLQEYKKLEAFLENPDGSMKFPHVLFCYLPLARAMDNVSHDEPGFWEKWAENF